MMDDSSNTTPKQPGGVTGKGFVKGDPRINRRGRPKVFDELRALSLQIAHEPALKANGEPIVINGHKVTVVEATLRQWWQSKDPRLRMAAVEIAFGKVPDRIDIESGGLPIAIREVIIELPKPDEPVDDRA